MINLITEEYAKCMMSTQYTIETHLKNLNNNDRHIAQEIGAEFII